MRHATDPAAQPTAAGGSSGAQRLHYKKSRACTECDAPPRETGERRAARRSAEHVVAQRRQPRTAAVGGLHARLFRTEVRLT